jgi:AraC-like DNA-binding protein
LNINSQHNDVFITSKPQSEKIKRYIAYYYFHYSTDDDYKKSFIFYPNYKHAITVYINSQIEIINDHSIVKPCVVTDLTTLYSINKNKSVKVTIEGKFNKIGIVFNPLGINHFFTDYLSSFLKTDMGIFPHFGKKFDLTLEQVLHEIETEKRVILLDQFFEESLQPFNETIIKKAIGEIIVSNGGIKVDELSKKINVNRKTLLRQFQKHVLMSVEEYRKMVMFRQAFNYFHQNKDKTNLTDVALFSMYYDQAHFIRHFKSITKETPNTLLSKVSHLGLEGTYWYFEN